GYVSGRERNLPPSRSARGDPGRGIGASCDSSGPRRGVRELRAAPARSPWPDPRRGRSRDPPRASQRKRDLGPAARRAGSEPERRPRAHLGASPGSRKSGRLSGHSGDREGGRVVWLLMRPLLFGLFFLFVAVPAWPRSAKLAEPETTIRSWLL